MKAQHVLFSGFTVLLAPVRLRSFRQLQSFFAVHLGPVIILEAAFSFPEGRTVVIGAFFYSQRSLINSLSRYLGYVNMSIVLWNQIQHSIQSRWPYGYKFLSSMRSDIYHPFQSCDHRRIGWMPWKGDSGIHPPTAMRNDKLPLWFRIGSRPFFRLGIFLCSHPPSRPQRKI